MAWCDRTKQRERLFVANSRLILEKDRERKRESQYVSMQWKYFEERKEEGRVDWKRKKETRKVKPGKITTLFLFTRNERVDPAVSRSPKIITPHNECRGNQRREKSTEQGDGAWVGQARKCTCKKSQEMSAYEAHLTFLCLGEVVAASLRTVWLTLIKR